MDIALNNSEVSNEADNYLESQLAGLVKQLKSSSDNQINIVKFSPQINDQRRWINNTNVQESEVTVVAGDTVTKNTEELATSAQNTEIEAISELVKLQQESYSEEVEYIGIEGAKVNLPMVHPRMAKVSFYDELSKKVNEKYVPSNQKQNHLYNGIIQHKEIKFEELLGSSHRSKFVALIGFPGSGKTTCSKRLAKSSGFLCFHVRFMDINYGPETKLTLKELLLSNMYPSLSEDTCNEAFNWIVCHDDQCVIIMDGYDQAEWEMLKNPPKVSYKCKQTVGDLVANLCCKHFLPGALLLITSRPHSMITLPKELRPQITILLQDFTFEDMKRLLFALAGSVAEKMWKELNDKAPQLISFCQNPLMLQFVVRAYLNPDNTIEDISTITKVFASVMEDLRYSSHTRIEDIQMIMSELSRIAFGRTQQHSVTIRTSDLKKENLNIPIVQDLMIALHGKRKPGSKLFEGDTKLFFSHQTLQEYLSALYIKNGMPMHAFKNFLYCDFFRPHWAMVRRFLCGLLVSMEKEQKTSSIIKRRLGLKSSSQEELMHMKRELLVSKLGERLKKKFKDDPNYAGNPAYTPLDMSALSSESHQARHGVIEFWSDIRECNDHKLILTAARYFPKNVSLHAMFLSSSDCHAISFILRKVDKKIESLRLDNNKMSDHSLSLICSAIREMPGSVHWLRIGTNNLSTAAVDLICGILPFTERINMTKCFKDPDSDTKRSANEEEKQKIQAALNALPSSNETSVLVSLSDQCILTRKTT